jgi:hypothetical protein
MKYEIRGKGPDLFSEMEIVVYERFIWANG